MVDDLNRFGDIERMAIAVWMLVIGAWVAVLTPDHATDPLILFSIGSAAFLIVGGPALRVGWGWIQPRFRHITQDT